MHWKINPQWKVGFLVGAQVQQALLPRIDLAIIMEKNYLAQMYLLIKEK